MRKGIHLIPFALYFVIYLIWFQWLENRHVRNFQIIHVFLDDCIPFCEVFIIPYLLWFLYVPAAVLLSFSSSRDEYIRCALFLCTGRTVFLLISTFFPNIQQLRPAKMPRDNVFTHLVALLQKADTPTNLWPSIHVYNSIGSHIAVSRCLSDRYGIKALPDSRAAGKGRSFKGFLSFRKLLCAVSLILCVSIILATMFLKQHSVFDVITAFLLAGVMYVILYRYDLPTLRRQRQRRPYRRRILPSSRSIRPGQAGRGGKFRRF